LLTFDFFFLSDKLLKLTEVMARHSFSVTDMRDYFRLLRDTYEKKNMLHLEKLLRSFQSMCYKRGPAAVFDFDGEKSCVSAIPRHFITFIKINAGAVHSSIQNACRRLFVLYMAEG